MKLGSNRIALALLSLACAAVLSGCPTVFFGSSHESFSGCARRCREMGMQLSSIDLHGEFASSCGCSMPRRREDGAQ